MITAFLSALDLTQVNVVGHDTGGAVGIIAPWNSEEGKLSLLRNASALNANQTMALVDRHGDISAPTLILWAMDDPWQKSEDGGQLAQEIPGAIFQSIEGASHWVQQDAPEQFSSALLAFLESSTSKSNSYT